MHVYEYTGQLPQGTAITGTLEAANLDDARRLISDLRIHLSSLTRAPRIARRRALSREDLTYFNQQLASLAETGVALDTGLRAVADDLQRGPLKETIEKLATDLEAGLPLEQAIRRQSGRFPPLYANVLEAGVDNNQLGATLLNLNNHLQLVDSTRRVLLETVTYPLIVMAFFLAIVTFFLIVVVPGFSDIVTDFDVQLPGPTKFIFDASHAWPLVLSCTGVLLVLTIFAWRLLRKSPAGHRLRMSLMGIIPGLSGAYRASLVTRFTNAAALGSKTGQPLPALLRSAAGATGDDQLTREAERLAQSVEAGGPPEQSIVRTRVIPSIVSYTIQVAGARGELTEALADLARTYEAHARFKLAMIRLIMGPLAIILVAGFLGIAILALFMPLISLINSLTDG